MPIRNSAKVWRLLGGRYPTTMLGGWGKERVNPFHMLIGTILSARSRDEMTEVICRKLFKRYPTPRALASARRPGLERMIHSIGFYRQKSRHIVETARLLLRDHGGRVPRTIEELMEFPGVGRKVANCVLVYAFGRQAIPVDTHVHRLSNRLGWVRTTDPEETERELVRIIPRRQWMLVNELMVAHGKAVCKPIGPSCGTCPIERLCAKRGVKR